MENHDNHKEKHGWSMMWMMVICCAMPALAILLLGSGAAAFGGGYLFPIIALVLLTACISMMFRRHKPHGSAENHAVSEAGKAESAQDMKQDHSCCH